MASEHEETISWFENTEGAEVWYRSPQSTHWSLVASPSWLQGHKYVPNDEHAEARKAFADGKKLKIKCPSPVAMCISPKWDVDAEYIIESN